ncbi:hypothetical protein [Herbaspirillum sp.]|uniref:hypothetical protein n=1 Tax=Herbaspirillum sp. TaxID=1890675 RepID=UPI000C0E21BC|nr:hypothetical protein [Herbaspirillum sp.]MBO18863.1 hypothetical protein [Herbaspirillum sp.]|tara:strand:- start:157 stop:405 length:249 start_codon:yes stop_codon:yes gene_type:complete
MTEIDLNAHAKRWAEAVEKTPILASAMGLTNDGGLLALDATHGHFTVELWKDPADNRWHILTADTRKDGESSSHPCNYKENY